MNSKPVPEIKNVGIWIRVSTEDQAQGESPEHHLERAKNYAAAKGWKVKEVYDLAGVSGKSVIDHVEAKRMLADVERGHITGLIFSKLARLARNTRELLDFADYFRTHNADLVSLQESIDTSTPAGRLFYTMIAAMAQWEREETVDRVKASIAIRAKLGSPLGGPAPFGYQWKDKKLVLNEREALIRRQMYDLFLEHRRKKKVVRLLNEAGHRTRKGARFTSKTVTRLLQDPTAKGVHRANYTTRHVKTKQCVLKPANEWVIHKCEPIVSEEIWEECNRLIDSTYSHVRKPTKVCVHPFAGITVCECGGKMYVPKNSPKYICQTCRNKIPSATLDEVYRNQIKTYSFSPERINAHVEQADQTVREKEQLLRAQQNEFQNVQREMEKTYQLYQKEKLDEEGFSRFFKPLDERRKQLDKDVPRLQAEIDLCKVNTISAGELASEAVTLSSQWVSLAQDEKRRIVETITEKIVVGKSNVSITFCYMPSSEDMSKRWRKGWDLNPR